MSLKKKRGGALEDNISNKKIVTAKVSSGRLWGSKTGNTTESDSVDMEEEFLVEETSFDHDKSGIIAGRDLEQTPKSSKIQTKKALGKLLGKIDFLGGNDDDDILLDKPVVLLPPLKNLINVSVRKIFTLDISLDNVVGKSTQENLVVVRKLFSKINGFGEVSTPSKFAGIVRVTFISEVSLIKVTKLATDTKILVNTNFKKSFGCSDQAVMVKEIPVGILVKTVHTAFFKFGIIKSVKIQLADLLASRWFILIGKDAVHILLYTLLMRTNAHDIWNYIGSVSGKTCVIDHHPITYARARCVIVCFGSAESLDAVMGTTLMLRGAYLHWSYLDSVACTKCNKVGYTFLSCAFGKKISSGSLSCWVLTNADKNRLAAIYAKCSVPVSHSVFFGGVSWAKIVVGSSFFSFSMKPIPHVSLVLNNRFATLEHSFASLAEHMDELVKRLDTPGPMVFQLSPGWADIVMSEGSGVVTGGKTVVGVVVFDPAVILKMEKTLNNFSITVISLLAKMNNADINVSAKQEDIVCWHRKSGNLVSIVTETKLRSSYRLWIKDRFDGVWVFTSGLNTSFLGAGVAIIMNISLAHHVCKISEVLSWLFSIKLLFKNKLLVLILGLYTGKVNSLIAKAVNESSFVILDGNFNEDEFHKYTNFKKCSDFGLINSLGKSLFMKVLTWSNSQGVSKTINYMFVSSSLANAVVHHAVLNVSEHFDTDYQAVFVFMGLSGLLDTRFKDASAANATMFFDDFIDTVHKFVTLSANEIFKKKWFKDFGHIFIKESSKFYRLELLVSKIVRAFHRAVVDGFDLVDSGATFDHVCSAFCIIRKSYSVLKCVKSLKAKKANIRSVIDKKMESFKTNKGHTIRSVLKCPFYKVVFDHLVVNDELVLEFSLVKSKMNAIMKSWTQKCQIVSDVFSEWHCQYQPLEYVFDRAFSGVMCSIGFYEFFGVVSNLPDGKAASLLDISNELWKHCDKSVLDMLLVLLNSCLVGRSVPSSWKEAWVLMISKWENILTNTCPIALIEMAHKILFKILSDRISSACSTFDVLCGNNFLVLKGTTIQSLIFKAYNSIGWEHLEKSLVRIKMFMMDFGLTNGYHIHDGLDQEEESVCGYRINSHFISKSGCTESQAGFSFFLLLNTTQHILDVVSKFFQINNISINNNKTVAIPINNKVSHPSLFISGLLISVARKEKSHQYLGIFLSTEGLSKPSLTKAHLDICFFTNLVLKKAFSFVSISVCNKWDALICKGLKLKSGLLLDFSGNTIYYPSFYDLKSFLQCQSESKIASLISFTNSVTGFITCKFYVGAPSIH
ncbi:hypothetical protein G9A89_006441 [Geosiphon pyriformis]|nr:hypothetical protein G9A89_006441 [Geosiphon pyriformis]